MKKETTANRNLWDLWTRIHIQSDFYSMDNFRRGRLSLTSLEQEEIGDVYGKRLLHLQCHFGQDTLSWARLGAHVTGVDFSEDAIRQANAIASELKIPAQFVCADLESASVDLGESFDIIYTSFGVLSWLSDLTQWGKFIEAHLAPNGFFYILEFHPVLGMLDEEGKWLEYSYFHDEIPIETEETISYTGGQHSALPCYQWSHSLSDVLNTLIQSGLKIEFIHEFPYCLHNCYPFLTEASPGKYMVKNYPNILPLMFSIKACR